jgi:phosphohistidine phosphatase
MHPCRRGGSPNRARLDAVLSSTALRARTTASFFGAALGLDVELDPELYGAPAGLLLEAAAARRRRRARRRARPGDDGPRRPLSDGAIGRMPTCAVATFRWTPTTGPSRRR